MVLILLGAYCLALTAIAVILHNRTKFLENQTAVLFRLLGEEFELKDSDIGHTPFGFLKQMAFLRRVNKATAKQRGRDYV